MGHHNNSTPKPVYGNLVLSTCHLMVRHVPPVSVCVEIHVCGTWYKGLNHTSTYESVFCINVHVYAGLIRQLL
jgi:hypothetical protein